MSASGLPRRLGRGEFDSDDEYVTYLESEAGLWSPDLDASASGAWRVAAQAALSRRVSVELPPEALARLDARAETEGLSREAIARRVLEAWASER